MVLGDRLGMVMGDRLGTVLGTVLQDSPGGQGWGTVMRKGGSQEWREAGEMSVEVRGEGHPEACVVSAGFGDTNPESNSSLSPETFLPSQHVSGWEER